MFKSFNVAARVFERQIFPPRPSASINSVRQFYENFVPSCTIYDIDCPDNSFRKFTDDGKYLISFSRSHQELIVYRPTWLSFSCKGGDCNSHALPQKAKRFDSFFIQLYTVSLAMGNAFICKDFFLYLETSEFGLFATSTAQNHDMPSTEGTVNGVPCIEKITFYLVRLEDGVVLDAKVFCNDFINLSHSMGVFLHEDLLCIMSLRYQAIHIVQIRDSGNFVDVRMIGKFCREDDELFLSSHTQVTEAQSFLTGIKQRVLSYIFHKHWSEETDKALRRDLLEVLAFEMDMTEGRDIDPRKDKWKPSRIQHLKKKFYFHFQDYVDLIMWKVQLLDRSHLLIKFGSVDGGISRTTDQHPSFFAVYNMETTEIISFFQNSTEELYYLFEQFFDHFNTSSRTSLHANFISSHSNNIYALDQLCVIKHKASSFLQFVKKMVTSLPYACQSQSPSPYFDLSLFRYDDKLISATDRHRHSTELPIKFISRRQPHILKFKIKPGPEAGGSDAVKRISSFLFHPYLPLAISIQQTFMQQTVVNIHFRR